MAEETPLQKALREAREYEKNAAQSTKASPDNNYKDMTYEDYIAEKNSPTIKKKSIRYLLQVQHLVQKVQAFFRYRLTHKP